MNLRSRTIAAVCLLLIGASGAWANDFYAGKTIEMIVGSDVGGGYDIYTRTIARNIGRHIPGNPTVVVKNMPGAGSGRAASYLYSVAPKDGTALAAVFPGVLVSPLLDDRVDGMFEATRFTFVGTADNGTRVCATHQSSKTRSYGDALT